jgi:peptide/nickel transport system substrate-binding protein
MKPNYSKVFLPTLLGLGVSLSLSTPLAQAATPKDTLVIAKNIDDIISLDPAEVYEPSAGEVINNVYNRLFSFKPGDFTKVVGDVAEKWTVARDGKTFTIHLRQGLTFASGHKLTAADVAFSLQRVVILGKSPAFILTQFGWTADNVKTQVTAPDDRTVVLKLSDAFAPSFLLNALSSSVT